MIAPIYFRSTLKILNFISNSVMLTFKIAQKKLNNLFYSPCVSNRQAPWVS